MYKMHEPAFVDMFLLFFKLAILFQVEKLIPWFVVSSESKILFSTPTFIVTFHLL